MYQRILVPIDGSATAARGLAEAVALGRLTGARLQLVHVIDELSFALAASEGLTLSGDLLGLLREAGAAILADAQATVRAAGLEVETVLKDGLAGRVADLVLDQASAWGAELLVLGTHGRRGIGRLFMGSDAESIVRQAAMPVLLIRCGGPSGYACAGGDGSGGWRAQRRCPA
jgi:nucleotide-binding universal stress UspA family protein